MNEPMNSVPSDMSPQNPPADSSDNIEMAQDHVDSSYKHIIRKVQINRQLQEMKFKKNSISTSKYSVFTFLFKFLFEQLQKYSNIFFIGIVALQVIKFYFFYI